MKKLWEIYRTKWLLINLTIGAIIALFDLYIGILTLIGLTAAIILFVWINSGIIALKYYFNDKENKEES